MTETVLELCGLAKRFGAIRALAGVDLRVQRGDLFGFLGQNGAGKTTAIKILARLVRASSGTASLLGRDVATSSPRTLFEKVGFLVEAPSFFPYLSGLDNLLLHARLLGLAPAVPRCLEMLERFGLAAAGRRRVREYSLGMQQRLGIAQALLGNPELLILDEPTNGLDPEGIARVREILRQECRQHGRSVFLSSHLLMEVEQLCSHVAVIHEGQIIADGAVAVLLQEGESVRIRTSDAELAAEVLAELEVEVLEAGEDGLCLQGDDASVARVVQALSDRKIDVYEVTRQRRSLEEFYRDLTRQGAAWQAS